MMDEEAIRRLRLRAEVSRADGKDIDAETADNIFLVLAELNRLRAEGHDLAARIVELEGRLDRMTADRNREGEEVVRLEEENVRLRSRLDAAVNVATGLAHASGSRRGDTDPVEWLKRLGADRSREQDRYAWWAAVRTAAGLDS